MNTKVTIAGVTLKNPILTASGTFGSGQEYAQFIDLNCLGGVITKGVANVPWEGNPTPRVAEVYGGMLNAVGLQNPGVDVLIKRDLPFLRQYDTKVIVNICGRSVYDYLEVAERLKDQPVDMLEVNISCPNVKEGGIAFGQAPNMAAHITKEIRKISKHPIVVKLSPNVTNIGEMAKAVEAAGADAVSLINTLTGMKIDVKSRRFALANRTGGLSGPAVHPVAVRMVYEASHAVNIPIIGMGGVMNAEDALELMLAGATAVAVGTANFANPTATVDIINDIRQFMVTERIQDINELIGAVHE
ncbi:Dihydroorotate dehydrogenase B (NAD(+)), catalytic subunit [Eubacterium plexicaudatum ASF492]|uniref:Dihydroorotate dehydrogenase n=1 Tax=Eubacterium plexicaudatum ASF492 TaxID=1235802 RepID=N1ZVC9_9FIRM|nr:Dihydroorotate dehydrogenase B (NAD(+)), catalytic subunit [Eubacterium plexicaudatum ASF492]